jgi:hypothetical protein
VTHDEFSRREAEARDILDALGQLSRAAQASPGFAENVLAQAEQFPVPRRGYLGWLTAAPRWPSTMAMRCAVAAVCVLVVIGAVSQYVTWIRAALLGVPSGTLAYASLQEKLWEKNFACATQLDQHSDDYALITSEHVIVVAWACPSGDVLVTVESPAEERLERSVWVALDGPARTSSLWHDLVRRAYAAAWPLYARRPADPMIAVICQKWLPNKLVKRRIRRANGKCVDEVINPRNGRVVQRQPAPCARDC